VYAWHTTKKSALTGKKSQPRKWPFLDHSPLRGAGPSQRQIRPVDAIHAALVLLHIVLALNAIAVELFCYRVGVARVSTPAPKRSSGGWDCQKGSDGWSQAGGAVRKAQCCPEGSGGWCRHAGGAITKAQAGGAVMKAQAGGAVRKTQAGGCRLEGSGADKKAQAGSAVR